MRKKLLVFFIASSVLISQIPSPTYATFSGQNGKISAFKYGRGVIFDGCDTSGSEFGQMVFSNTLTNPTKLTVGGDSNLSPQSIRWSPDGRQYIFPTGQWSLSIADTSTNTVTGGLSYHYEPDSPGIAWAPDGITLSLANSGLFTMRLNEQYPTFITWGIPGDMHTLGEARWSPKGDFIVYSKPVTGPPHYDRIGILRPDGTDHHLFPKPSQTSYDFGADWSPDGSKIVFASNRAQEAAQSYNDPTQIFIMNPDGTQISQLTSNYSYRYEEPVWSPDGTKIAVIRTQPNTTNSISIAALDAQTGAEIDVYIPECNIGFSNLEWQPLGPTKVYRMANWKTKERLFTTNKSEALSVPNSNNGWVLEGAAFNVQDSDDGDITPIYRLANWKTKERLFTTSAHERDYAITHYEGWVSEGTAFYAAPGFESDLMPVYRLANWKSHERLFTTSAYERDYAITNYDGWVSEGVAFYVPSN